MDEHDVTTLLGSLSDEPVEPPGEFRSALREQIRVEWGSLPADADAPLVIGEEPAIEIGRPPTRRRRVGGPFLAAAVFAVVALVGVTVWYLAPGAPAGEPVGSPEPASLDEFAAAIRRAVEPLHEAPALERLTLSFRGDDLSLGSWADHRANGDYISVERTYPAAGGGDRIATRVEILVGDSWYAASRRSEDDAATWSVWDVDAAPTQSPRRSRPLSEMADGSFVDQIRRLGVRADVTRQDISGGGSLWTLHTSTTQTFTIHPDGYLSSFTAEFPPTDPPPGVSTMPPGEPSLSRGVFTPRSDPAPITPPEPGTPLDLGDYDIPDELLVDE